jgi:predicted Zn-dependent protease
LEADRIGLDDIAQAGYRPSGAMSPRRSTAASAPAILSTHLFDQ